MFARYNNILYGCVKYDNAYHLITQSPAKTDSSFRQDNGGYYIKDVQLSDPLLTDLYEVDIFVMYKGVLYSLPLTISTIPQDKTDSIVLNLNQNKRVYKIVPISDLNSVVLRRYYIKRSGKENSTPKVEDEDLPDLTIRDKIHQIVNI